MFILEEILFMFCLSYPIVIGLLALLVLGIIIALICRYRKNKSKSTFSFSFVTIFNKSKYFIILISKLLIGQNLKGGGSFLRFLKRLKYDLKKVYFQFSTLLF